MSSSVSLLEQQALLDRRDLDNAPLRHRGVVESQDRAGGDVSRPIELGNERSAIPRAHDHVARAPARVVELNRVADGQHGG